VITTAFTSTPGPQVIDELQRVRVVGDAEIGAYLLALDVPRVDAEDQVRLVLEKPKQPHLDVGIVPGKHAGRMKVVHQLAAELKVELVVEPFDALKDGGRLFRKVLFRCRNRFDRTFVDSTFEDEGF